MYTYLIVSDVNVFCTLAVTYSVQTWCFSNNEEVMELNINCEFKHKKINNKNIFKDFFCGCPFDQK